MSPASGSPHLVIVTQVYPPEVHPTGVMVAELARDLNEHGWRVTVVTGFPHHPHGRLPEGWRRRPWRREERDGVDVVRTWHLLSESRSVPARGAVLASQMLGNALGAVLLARRPDVVLVYGAPLLGAVAGMPAARLAGVPFVNVIYDLYPDIAIETGAVRSPAVIAASRLAERAQYRAAKKTVVLSEGFRQALVGRGVPRERVEVIPVWLDGDEVRPGPRLNDWRREQDLPEDLTVVLYAGTIGVVSGAAVVLDAAARLAGDSRILFLFVGEGAVKAKLEKDARLLGLPNVRFLPFQPREQLSELQAAADVGLVTLSPGRGRTSVPSKVLGYLAAGRPVVASVDADSETAHQVRDTGAGLVCEPGDGAALAQAVLELADEPAKRTKMGHAARAAFEKTFMRTTVLAQYRRMLESLIQ